MSAGRAAVPIAGEDEIAKRQVAALHEALGFDVLDAGSLGESWRFERAKPAYCIALDRSGLQRAIATVIRDGEALHRSWRR